MVRQHQVAVGLVGIGLLGVALHPDEARVDGVRPALQRPLVEQVRRAAGSRVVLQRAHVEVLVGLGEVDAEHLDVAVLAADRRLDLRPGEASPERHDEAVQRGFPAQRGPLGAEVPHAPPVLLHGHERDVRARAHDDLDPGVGQAGLGEVAGAVPVQEDDRGPLVHHHERVREDPHASLRQGPGGLDGDLHVHPSRHVEEGAAGEEGGVQRREDVLARVPLAQQVALDEFGTSLDGVVERQEHDAALLELGVAPQRQPGVVRVRLGRREVAEIEAEAAEIRVAPRLVLLPGQLELLVVAPGLQAALGEPGRLIQRAAQRLDLLLCKPHVSCSSVAVDRLLTRRLEGRLGLSRRSPPSGAGSAG